ncbi:hypothetical protein N8I77_002673 [Diaporthe amygdali]|uniref:Exonuclease domain-containing protein n=1 Tax=Phomopsis amygdali TaxID=1214568 RepID=A0AAD9SUL9_PHOAM|nr:hypothetical protein N8I77_002673 [Diaporthe amygdali]
MVGMEDGASELISLAAVDFITGELIVNSLVKPRRPVVDWRTQIHGISPARMSMAHAQGQTLDGWQSATAELFRLVDQDTVLIGHSLQYDLAALHIRPASVVDSAILASDAIFPKKGKPRYWGLGLKDMCSDLLGLNIREGAPLHASNVHDGVEDVLATREVVLCFLERPRMSKAWTTEKRNTFWKGQTRKVPRGKNKPQRRQKPPRPNDEDDDYLSDEILRWEDVIDYDMWPKSPPDSD